jgi:hypothetical protein
LFLVYNPIKFTSVIRRFIIPVLLLAYGLMMAHSIVPHYHEVAAVETHHHHHGSSNHHEHKHQHEQSPLGHFAADVVHLAGSGDFLINHFATPDYKKSSPPDYAMPAGSVTIDPPFVPPVLFRKKSSEESIPTFSITNTPLRAPPVA